MAAVLAASQARVVEIPYRPRRVFEPFHERQQRWAVVVAHRRCGKTVACINDIIRRAICEAKKDGRYGYIAPQLNQAREIAWEYLQRYARPILRESRAYPEMSVTLLNGSRIRLYGADNPDALRGTYYDGLICDEYADWQPRVWGEILRPALADRQGWAVFIGTPRGHNAFFDLYQAALKLPGDWYTTVLRASATGLLSQAELDDMRRSMTQDQYDQELECSWEAALFGAIYAKELAACREAGRICRVPHDPLARVDTWWDLGVGDATAVVFTQTVGRELHVIDYHEASGEGLPYYAQVLDRKGYLYGSHNAPHDIAIRELGSGRSRIEAALSLGIRFRTVANIPLEDGIHAGRLVFARAWIDEERCAPLIEALTSYRWEYNERLGELKPTPRHDWSSHGADAWRYMAVGLREDRGDANAPLKLNRRFVI